MPAALRHLVLVLGDQLNPDSMAFEGFDADAAAQLAVFLLGPGGDWIQGQVIALDGGFSAVRPMVKGAG